MADPVALMLQGLREFGDRLDRVPNEQWGAPTPCTEWSVTALADHVIDESLWVAPLLAGHGLEAANEIVEGAKASARGDRISLWRTASTNAATAWTEPGAMDRMVALSRGPTPVPAYLDEMLVDVTVHSWDLGTAVGVLDPLPEDQVGYVLGIVEASGDLAATGAFAPPVPVDDGASPEAKLVALTGRRPR
jgi:uncharacterized protein (TIGR03086 family)